MFIICTIPLGRVDGHTANVCGENIYKHSVCYFLNLHNDSRETVINTL